MACSLIHSKLTFKLGFLSASTLEHQCTDLQPVKVWKALENGSLAAIIVIE